MCSIHQLFEDQEIVRRATTDCGRETLCWYPSAGDDFRHINFLEEERLSRDEGFPLVYIHTDIRLPLKESSKSDSKNREMLAVDDQVGKRIKISRVTEIHPKKKIQEFSEGVCHFVADAHAGKVFLMELEMEAVCHGQQVVVPIPVIYFISENLAFLVRAFLQHQIRVNTLVHIQDGGGSFGGSNIQMNFIYQVAHILKLHRVLCDEEPTKKRFNTSKSYHLLMKEVMKCQHINHQEIQKISRHDIEADWMSERIGLDKFPRGRYSRADSEGYEGTRYHDWQRVWR